MEVIDNAKQQTKNPGIILNYTRRTNPGVLTLPSKKVVSCKSQEVLQRTFLILHPLVNWTSKRSKKYFCTPSVRFLTSSLRLKTLQHCYLKLFFHVSNVMIKLSLYFLLLILVFVHVVFDNHGSHFGQCGSMQGHCGSLFQFCEACC